MSTSLHILVVDDRPDSVLFLTEFLLSRQHRVETTGNGQDALDAVIQRQRSRDVYDLVISDVTMPTMDGLAMVRELRRRQVTVPVVLYTAYGTMNPNLNQQASQAGATLHLDLLPDVPLGKVLAEVRHPRGSRSLTSHLKSRGAPMPAASGW